MLPMWIPGREPAPDERMSWLAGAERIATGITTLAHLDPFVDVERLRVGFTCRGNAELAIRYEAAILAENIACQRVATPLPDAATLLGRIARRLLGASDLPPDEIALSCRPDATDEQIQQAVLAVMKAAHAIEFDLEVEDISGATMGLVAAR
jgi:hypothetical protein